jgi:tetratricopeptide (TPR) repeat protein
MRRQTPARFAVLFLLLAVATVARAQQTASIIGVARVVRGSFPEPVLVKLQVHGATALSAYTDAEGRFSFSFLLGNVYHVVINDDRYMPVDMLVEVRPDIVTTNILQVILVSREAKANTPAGPYVVSSSDFTRNYPRNAVKEFERGVKTESEGKTDQAIQHYRKAIKEAPNFAMAHNNLGSLYLGKSQFPEAQKELEQSIRLAPGDSKAYFNMANLMLLTGKLADAQPYLQDGFRTQPDSAFGYFVQGSVLERSGKLSDAERALQRALELDPKMPRPRLELVNLYLRERRPADAISQLHQFLQVAPKDPFAPQARDVLKKLESANPSSRK